jgi:hypothetical protein
MLNQVAPVSLTDRDFFCDLLDLRAKKRSLRNQRPFEGVEGFNYTQIPQTPI